MVSVQWWQELAKLSTPKVGEIGMFLISNEEPVESCQAGQS